MASPKSNKNPSAFVQRQLKVSEESFNFRIQNEKEIFHGVIQGISSNNKGYLGSKLDTHRDGFKFLVNFPRLGITRFVTPRNLPEFYYSNYGLNEEAYKGLPITIESTSKAIPLNPVGDITSGDCVSLKKRQGNWAFQNNEKNINSLLVTKKDIIVESIEPDTGAFGGALNCAHKFLLNHLAKRGNHV